jgi:hypothetical protein
MAAAAFEHLSVMPEEVLHWLKPQAGGVYLDGTLGGAGHSRLILEAAPDVRLVGLDRDPAALQKAAEVLAPFAEQVSLHHATFSEAGKVPIPTCWSQDGREVYVSLREGAENPNSSIWAISATGEGNRQLTLETESAYPYADLSPDGSLLAVVWREGSSWDLWAMSSAGGARVQITSHPSYDDGPSWSPDGTRIAFVSRRSGSFDIWTIEVDVERVRRELMKGGVR